MRRHGHSLNSVVRAIDPKRRPRVVHEKQTQLTAPFKAVAHFCYTAIPQSSGIAVSQKLQPELAVKTGYFITARRATKPGPLLRSGQARRWGSSPNPGCRARWAARPAAATPESREEWLTSESSWFV